MECPKDLQTRAGILHINGLFGFQPPYVGTIRPEFLFCFCRYLAEREITQLRELSGSKTLYSDSCYAGPHLKIGWSEYDKIPAVFKGLLTMGISFATQAGASVSFEPGETYSQEAIERKHITSIKNSMKYDPTLAYLRNENELDVWNWKTAEGKEFCRFMRRTKRLPEQNEKTDNRNYLLWPIFQNYDPATLLTIETPLPPLTIVITDSEEEDNTCMICLDHPPDTMVLPCEHVVVCHDCSVRLQHTNDAKICVQCRRPITAILD